MGNDRLAEALVLYEAQWLASLPPEEELARIELSPRFMRRMSRLFVLQRKPYYPYVNRTWKRAVLAVVMALMLFAASMSVSAIRGPVIRFVIEIYEKFSSLFFDADHVIEEMAVYKPTYLPDGYTLTGDVQNRWEVILQYENAEGKAITFRQYRLHDFVAQTDTESVVIEEVEINTDLGILVQNKGCNNLVWSNGKYSFSLIAELNKMDMIKVAYSVETAK